MFQNLKKLSPNILLTLMHTNNLKPIFYLYFLVHWNLNGSASLDYMSKIFLKYLNVLEYNRYWNIYIIIIFNPEHFFIFTCLWTVFPFVSGNLFSTLCGPSEAISQNAFSLFTLLPWERECYWGLSKNVSNVTDTEMSTWPNWVNQSPYLWTNVLMLWDKSSLF